MWETFIWVKLSGKENQLHLENQMQYFFFFGFRNKKNFLGEKHVHGWNKCMKKKSSREFFFHVMKSAILCQIFFITCENWMNSFFFKDNTLLSEKKCIWKTTCNFFFRRKKVHVRSEWSWVVKFLNVDNQMHFFFE